MDFEKYRKKKKVITIHLDEETKLLLDSYLEKEDKTKQQFLETYIKETVLNHIKKDILNF